MTHSGAVALQFFHYARLRAKPALVIRSACIVLVLKATLRGDVYAGNLSPALSMVQLHDGSMWDRHTEYALIAILFLLLETALVAVLLLKKRDNRKTQQILARRIALEQVISDCSTRLSDCEAGRVDDEIENGLKAILETEGADRTSWFAIPGRDQVNRCAYSASRPGIDNEPTVFSWPELPWSTERLLRGEAVSAARLEDLPPDAYRDRQYLAEKQVKSIALIPSSSVSRATGVMVLVSLSGEREWTDSLSSRLGVLGNIFANALMRKNAQKAEEESEHRFRYLFDQSPVGIALEDLQGHMLFVNPCFCSMVGYTSEELRGMSCAQISDPDDHQAESMQFQQMLDGHAESYQIDKRFRTKRGAQMWGRVNVSLLRNGTGGAPTVLAMVEDITERKNAEDRLTAAQGELQGLTAHLIQAQEDDRQRIARELHDDIGQRLSLLMLDLNVLGQNLPPGNSGERTNLSQLIRDADELATDIHGLSHRLHSAKLKHLGLEAALKELCSQIARQHHLKVDLAAERVGRLPEDVAQCFYRVAQEALSNVVRHSGARMVTVRLNWQGSALGMQIKDSGVGFDPGKQPGGLGLASMRERLRMIGGQFLVRSLPGDGTELLAEVAVQAFIEEAKAS